MIFHFRFIPQKHRINSKNTIFAPFSALFAQNWTTRSFLRQSNPVSFSIIKSYIHAKKKKKKKRKTNQSFFRKAVNSQKDRQTDRRADPTLYELCALHRSKKSVIYNNRAYDYIVFSKHHRKSFY